MDRLKLQNILINYTEDCILELLNEFQNKKGIKKPDILKYLRAKYKIVGCPPRGQRNYWILRGFSNEQAEIKIKEYSHVYSTLTVDSIMNRHGVNKDEADLIIANRISKMKVAYDNMQPEKLVALNKRKASNSLENCIHKYGNDQGIKIYSDRIEKLKNNVSLNGYITRYGIEIGTKLYKEFCDKVKIQNTLDGYIERYGHEKGKIEYEKTQNKKAFSHTLDGYIERYGHEKGKIEYEKRQKKYVNSLYSNLTADEVLIFNKSKGLTYESAVLKHGPNKANSIFNSRQVSASKASKESLKVLIPFYKYLRKNGITKEDVYWGISGSSEYFIRENEKFVTFDFTIKSKCIIIEYNGTAWHAKSKESDWVSPYGKSANDSYEYDKQKREMANRKGFTVITIWSDINHKINLQKIIQQYENITNNIC